MQYFLNGNLQNIIYFEDFMSACFLIFDFHCIPENFTVDKNSQRLMFLENLWKRV